MSIRDNDVTVSAENNTDNNTNGKVHQAPLAHAEKKSELPALLNKLKRAFEMSGILSIIQIADMEEKIS